MKPGILLVLGLLAALKSAAGENWPHWRGPTYDGASRERSLPAKFSKTENVLWSVALPGRSAATPIVWEDRVFVSSTDEGSKTLRALCVDRKDGKVLWNEETGKGYNRDDKNNLASPSPVTDGKVAVFLYGTGDLAAFDFSGKKLWERNLESDFGPFTYNWTYSASPTISEGRLLIAVLQRDTPVRGRGRTDAGNPSYLLALDPTTGKELWKHIRPTDARMESQESYATIIPLTHQGRAELLITGGDCITGHNPADGAELWRWGTWNPNRITHWRLVPSPVAGAGMVLACAPKSSPVYAFKAGAKGKLDDSGVAWKSTEREVTSDVATPLFYDGRFYVLKGELRASISRIEPATGKVEWTGELDTRAKIESSPTAADGKIFFQNFRGDVFVVALGPQFKLLGLNAMGDDDDDQLRASVAIAQGELFIRTGRRLYCVGGGAGLSSR